MLSPILNEVEVIRLSYIDILLTFLRKIPNKKKQTLLYHDITHHDVANIETIE